MFVMGGCAQCHRHYSVWCLAHLFCLFEAAKRIGFWGTAPCQTLMAGHLCSVLLLLLRCSVSLLAAALLLRPDHMEKIHDHYAFGLKASCRLLLLLSSQRLLLFQHLSCKESTSWDGGGFAIICGLALGINHIAPLRLKFCSAHLFASACRLPRLVWASAAKRACRQ